MSTARYLVLALGTSAFLLAGCGGDGGSSTGGSQRSGQGSAQPQPPAARAPGQGGQTSPGQMPGQAPQGGQTQVSDAQMEAAGRVYVALQERQLQLQEEGEMEGGPSKQAQKQLMQAMGEAIDQEDALSRQRFQLIMMSAQRNPQMQKRFFNAIDEAGGRVPTPPPSGGQSPSGQSPSSP